MMEGKKKKRRKGGKEGKSKKDFFKVKFSLE